MSNSDLPQYRSHKVVRASKIERINVFNPEGDAELFLEGGLETSVSGAWMTRVTPDFSSHNELIGGYFVSYDDGYASWSPAQSFESGYTLLNPADPGTTVEQDIQAKGLNAPRVTPGDLDDNIASEHFFTAADGVSGAARGGRIVGAEARPLHLLTFCVLVLKNGFTVSGTSACASPENFNAETGRKIARENAVREIWPLLGYALKDRLHSEPKDWRERLGLEKAELDGRIQKLRRFIENPDAPPLDPKQCMQLLRQLGAMNEYADSLVARINNLQPTPGVTHE